MPKLLSRSKHEEFESNSALQIRDHKERIAENARKLKLQFGRLPANFGPAAPVFLQLYAFVVLLQFFISSYFNPCNSFCIGLFCNFPYTKILYKPQFVQTLYQSTSINKVTGEASYSSAWLLLPLLYFTFFHFLFHFLGCQIPFDDDKSKDVRLNLPHPRRGRPLGAGFEVSYMFSCSSCWCLRVFVLLSLTIG